MAHEPDPTALERLIREGSDADLRRFLLLLRPPEVADLLEPLRNAEDRTRVLRVMSGRDRSEVVRDMEDGPRAEVLEELGPDEAAQVLSDQQTDDATDMLQALDEETQQAVLARIDPEERAHLQRMLDYPEDSAGGIMQTELVSVPEGATAREAVEEVRRTRDEVGELHEIFVVDAQGALTGWLSERALLLAEDDMPIRGLAKPVPVQVPVTLDQEEVVSLVQDYDVSSVPVVDAEQRLVGRILADDVLDVLEEEATEDITRLAGTSPEEIYDVTAWSALKARSPWLLITFAGGIAAAQIMRLGEASIHQAGVLFAFIPVIMGMGGGCSTQAATVTVRSLALGRINLSGVWGVVRKELVVGLVLSVASGLLLWLVTWISGGTPAVAAIAAISIFGTMCLGVMFGVVTPLFLDRMGADPAVATSPFVTTVNDLLGSTLIIVCCFAFL